MQEVIRVQIIAGGNRLSDPPYQGRSLAAPEVLTCRHNTNCHGYSNIQPFWFTPKWCRIL